MMDFVILLLLVNGGVEVHWGIWILWVGVMTLRVDRALRIDRALEDY